MIHHALYACAAFAYRWVVGGCVTVFSDVLATIGVVETCCTL
jgi:hypothetical protein